MKADLHIHSNCSDGKFTVEEIFQEAKARGITCLSITDHDSIKGQSLAIASAKAASIRYITGVELNVTFSHPDFKEGKTVSLDFLGYNFDPTNSALNQKLDLMVNCRQERAAKILSKLNAEFTKEALPILTAADFEAIHSSVDGALGRPHIADYLVKKGIVKSSQEAFDKYLVKCDVPKYPLYLKEASQLIRGANGKIVLAHPNDPHGISLQALTTSLEEQTQLVDASMLSFIDGVECWHSRSTPATTQHYCEFAKEHGLLMTGGSDCHQKPILMGTVAVPDWVAVQFG